MRNTNQTITQQITSKAPVGTRLQTVGARARGRITRSMSCGAAFLLAAACAWGQTAAASSSPKPDLSSPEATVISFTKAAARGETKLVQACFLPGGEDYDDIRKVMEATPGTPAYDMKAMLAALDLERSMPIVEKKQSAHGTKVVWRVTFKREFKPNKGPAFKAGSTYDFDATLKRSGNQWLIDNF